MRIHNLKAPQEPVSVPAPGATDARPTPSAFAGRGDVVVAEMTGARPAGDTASPAGHQALEIAFLKARIQHLELVVETARSLMGSNHERLLRRLHEVPRELVELGNQLRRVDSHTTW